jgi:hypothetical protein
MVGLQLYQTVQALAITITLLKTIINHLSTSITALSTTILVITSKLLFVFVERITNQLKLKAPWPCHLRKRSERQRESGRSGVPTSAFACSKIWSGRDKIVWM